MSRIRVRTIMIKIGIETRADSSCGNKTITQTFEGPSCRKMIRLVFDSKELSLDLCIEDKVRNNLVSVGTVWK